MSEKSTLFNREYVFRGKHAEMVIKLCSKLSEDYPRSLMPTNISVYEVAPLIGYLYNRRSPLDKSSDVDTKVFKDKMMDESSTLIFNYRLLMMLIDKDKKSNSERCEAAFKLDYDNEKRAPFDAVYDEYVRGGVEVLYEKIFKDAEEDEEYLMNMYSFLEEFYQRYYAEIEEEVF